MSSYSNLAQPGTFSCSLLDKHSNASILIGLWQNTIPLMSKIPRFEDFNDFVRDSGCCAIALAICQLSVESIRRLSDNQLLDD